MKSIKTATHFCLVKVTPFVGVWIEIMQYLNPCNKGQVTPFVGVWIEINAYQEKINNELLSLPSWECGLKFLGTNHSGGTSTSLPSWECGLK